MRTSVTIVQGEDRILTIRIVKESNGEPYDLTGATEIKACFINADGSVLTKLLTGGAISVISATLGKLDVTLTSAETQLLKIGEGLNIEIDIEKITETRVVQLPESLNVIERICS